MSEFGYIGLDLGVTTGMAWGIYNPALRDEVGLWTALARGKKQNCSQVYAEDILDEAEEVAKRVLFKIAEFNMRGMAKQNIRVCMEDFQARPAQVRGGKAKDKLAPVYLAGGVSTLLRAAHWDPCIRYYDPSLSKSKATDARLKDWAAQCRPKGKMGWVKGKQHSRDACRLIAVGLDRET